MSGLGGQPSGSPRASARARSVFLGPWQDRAVNPCETHPAIEAVERWTFVGARTIVVDLCGRCCEQPFEPIGDVTVTRQPLRST